MGRPIRVDPDLSLAKTWLADCDDHPLCSYNSKPETGFRVLDLQPPETNSDLRLVENFRNEERYVTLSHCWGESQPLKLTSATKDSFQQRIHYSHLPRTFQDAVLATRALGIRYLWIDSLCIIQDSQQDWEKQCALMVQIYRDSYVTIAGTRASSCSSGFLQPRDILSESVQVSDGIQSDKIILCHAGTRFWDSLHEPDLSSVLIKRGWILQERLLSRRILSIGDQSMHLECFTKFQTEACHYPIRPANFGMLLVVQKKKLDAFETLPELRRYWHHVIKTYSGLPLTKPTDKLPALSGLASEFQRLTGFTYLAGLWREHLPWELGWHIPLSEMDKFVQPPPDPVCSPFVAPSWSWASLTQTMEVSSCAANTDRGDSYVSALDILNAEVTEAGLDPFGQVSGAFIEARGKVQHATVQMIEPPLGVNKPAPTLGLLSSSGERLAIYYPDTWKDAFADVLDISFLYIGKFRGEFNFEWALGIKPVSSRSNTFRRVGLAINKPGYKIGGLEGIFYDQSLIQLFLI